jgi:cell filamentation protein
MGSGRKIKRPSKYSGMSSDEFQPGSHHRVLRNKLGITSKQEMDDIEIEKYRDAFLVLSEKYNNKEYLFSENDIKIIHKTIFQKIYDWAGEYRNVELSKEDFTFARARYVHELMKTYSEQYLSKMTPAKTNDKNKLASDLAVLHNEFIIIHPFREGNGRTIRLLLYLIALQVDFNELDFSFIDEKGESYQRYIGAIHEGMGGNHTAMSEIIKEALL